MPSEGRLRSMFMTTVVMSNARRRKKSYELTISHHCRTFDELSAIELLIFYEARFNLALISHILKGKSPRYLASSENKIIFYYEARLIIPPLLFNKPTAKRVRK